MRPMEPVESRRERSIHPLRTAWFCVLIFGHGWTAVAAPASVLPENTSFRTETAQLASRCLAEIRTLEDWNARRGEFRRQLFEMLGLDPLPKRGDLKAT